jgi:hypothetical protein
MRARAGRALRGGGGGGGAAAAAAAAARPPHGAVGMAIVHFYEISAVRARFA